MIKSLKDTGIANLVSNKFTPSPSAWEDQVLYFLLLDRFSDNNEAGFATNGTTPLFSPADNGNAIQNAADAKTWSDAGDSFTGGNLQGLINKIGYLKGLGITTIWLSPVFKQVANANSYHGYGIQNYLEIDPHYGTKEDLKELVDKAHAAGIYVILDIILNHSGNVFSYKNNTGGLPWNGNRFEVEGFNNATGLPLIPFTTNIQAEDDDAIWPVEFQDPDCFTQKGEISNFDYFPEFLEGDFFSLKDVNLGSGDIINYRSSPALKHLCEVYKYWIAFADLDGYRVDTVKHMDPGAARIFAAQIHEFAQKIGKDNFYLIGEITGSRENAINTLEVTGMDAALGIADNPGQMEYTVKGFTSPGEYFNLFRNSILVGKESHTWFRNKVVTMFDDHDKVSEGGHKTRFCADFNGDRLILSALALNVTTLGIRVFIMAVNNCLMGKARAMAATGISGKPCLAENLALSEVKSGISSILRNSYSKNFRRSWLSGKKQVALRRGRQFLREISGDGQHFGLPDFVGGSNEIRSVVPWSRILDGEEIVMAINTDLNNTRKAWITIDNELHNTNDNYTCIYSTDNALEGAIAVVEARNGKAIEIEVPAAGFAIYAKG